MEYGETIKILQEGHTSDFWKLMVEHLEGRIESIDNAIKNFDGREMSAEQYKFEIEILKERKDMYRRLIELPETLALEAQPKEEEKSLDPYDKP